MGEGSRSSSSQVADHPKSNKEKSREFVLGMIDLYANEYGWSRDQIINEVYLDEYFIQQDIIDKRKKSEHIQQVQYAMIPRMDNKALKKFLDNLQRDNRQQLNVGKGTETDFEGLKALKVQQEKEIK